MECGIEVSPFIRSSFDVQTDRAILILATWSEHDALYMRRADRTLHALSPRARIFYPNPIQ